MHRESASTGDLVKLTDGTATEVDARRVFEGMRWPNGVRCVFPDCGGAEVYRMSIKGKTLKSGRIVGPRELFKCKACRRQFSVTKGTIFEDSHIPLRTWLVVMYRMCSSKKSVSARQIEREFGLSHRAAWFMCHRIRWAMTDKTPPKLFGTVEADETYIGGKPRGHKNHRKPRTMSEAISASWAAKVPVFGMIERKGRVRAKVMRHVNQDTVEWSIFHGVDRERTHMMTDQHGAYANVAKMLPHDVIRHDSEYVRGEIHTQNIESFWAVLKRGLIGTYHHVDAAYLHQYVAEYEFRHNTRQVKDADRFMALASQTDGRLDVGDQVAS
jgi:transposase-like protein